MDSNSNIVLNVNGIEVIYNHVILVLKGVSLQVREAPFLRHVGAALANATRGLHPYAEARMAQLVAHFGRDVLWRHPESRVAENLLRAAGRWRGTWGPPLRGCCPMEDFVADRRRRR